MKKKESVKGTQKQIKKGAQKEIQKGTVKEQDGWKLNDREKQLVGRIKEALHRHPELSFQEYHTTELIRQILGKLSHIEILSFPMETGVVARLTGGKPGKTIGLRADIDAIEQTEGEEIVIRSEKEGIMHACGHDFHTAALLGTAMILNRQVEQVPGTVCFVFQPAEETTKGAAAMLKAGLLDALKPDLFFASHNRPEIPAGQIVVHKGGLMAAKNNFRIVVHGRGGHGSMPHKCVDPIVCVAAMIQSLQTVVSRNVDPLQSVVLTIGSVHGGSLENLVVDQVTMTGSMRVLSEEIRKMALERIQKMVHCTAQAYDCTAEFVMEQELPLCDNREPMVAIAARAAAETVGQRNVVDSEPTLASEDYSLLMEQVPAFLYWVGSGDGGPCYSWHNAHFHTEDKALPVGAELFVQSVLAANEGTKKA